MGWVCREVRLDRYASRLCWMDMLPYYEERLGEWGMRGGYGGWVCEGDMREGRGGRHGYCYARVCAISY
jgi:hypothetical protein